MAENVRSWDEVERDQRFRALPPEQKRDVRKQYFYDVVVPQLPPESISPAWDEFVKDTEPSMLGYDPKQPTKEYLVNRAKQGVASGGAFVVGGLADMASTPGMLLGAAGVPGMHDPTKDSGGWIPNVTALQGALEHSLGVSKGLLPPSRGAKYGGGVAEFAGSTIGPSSGIVAQAPRKIPALLSEITSTALGGAGYEAAGLPGGIVGGYGGAAGGPLLTKAWAKGTSLGSRAFGKQDARSIAGREIGGALEADPRSAGRMAEAAKVAARLEAAGGGRPQFTLGQRSGAEGIIGREHQIATSSPQDLSRYGQRIKETEDIVRRGQDIMFPEPKKSVSGHAQEASKAELSLLEKKLDYLNRQQETITRGLPATSRQAAGDRLLALRNQAQETAKTIKNKKIVDVYSTADRLGISEDMSDVVGLVDGIRGADINAFQKMPPVFGRVLAEFAEKPRSDLDINALPENFAASTKPVASFEKLHSLYREVNREIGAARRTGDAQTLGYLERMREMLTQKVFKYEGAEYGELGKQFRDFNTFYATKYAPAFRQGVGGRMVATGKRGKLLPPENIVSKFFTPSGVDDFNLIYGTSKEAQDALRDGVVALYRRAAMRNGEIDPKRAESFMRQHAETLEKLPDIRASIASPTVASKAIVESAKETKAAMVAFDKTYVAQLARRPDTTKLIDDALSGDQKALGELINLGRDADSKAAVARVIAERIPHIAPDPLAFVIENEKFLRSALDRLGPKHFDNLKTIMGAKTIMARPRPAHTVEAGHIKDPLEELTGTSTSSLMNMLRTVYVTRAGSVHGLGTVASGRFWNKRRREAAEALQREAIYDPQIAEDLARAMLAGKNITAELSNSVMNHLSALGFRLGAASDKDQ